MADAADKKLATGKKVGKLEGAPLGIKDLFCTEGVRTTACSNILGEFTPPYESTVTQNLWNEGAVMLGKLNMDEFAMGSSNETSRFGPPSNPWRRKGSNAALTAGGSSGGSATAVASDLCLAATASDTGGSIRQPAAFVGHHRHQADLRPRQPVRHGGVCVLARSGRSSGQDRERRGADAGSHVFGRRQGFHQPASAGSAVDQIGRQVGQGHEDRRAEGIPCRWHARRDRETLAAGHRLAEGGGRNHRRRVAAAHQIRAAGLLHRCAGGGVLQPRAL